MYFSVYRFFFAIFTSVFGIFGTSVSVSKGCYYKLHTFTFKLHRLCHSLAALLCCVPARVVDCHFFSATPAPLGKSCVSTGGPPRHVSASYNALADPHLYDYYVRKFVAMDPLMPAQSPQVTALSLAAVFIAGGYRNLIEEDFAQTSKSLMAL